MIAGVPELPDITVYVEALSKRVVDQAIRRVRVPSVSLLRTAVPPVEAAVGRTVVDVSRLGKRIVFRLEDELFLVLHLMIAGRLWWRALEAAIPRKHGLAAVDFDDGLLLITEAGHQRRASLHVVQGPDALAMFERDGLEVLDCSLVEFKAALTRENHTLKRAMTSPAIFSGIGNAYSDEILHRARLSPLTWTSRLHDEEIEGLWRATRDVLTEWTNRLRLKARGTFPTKVTAFHSEMAAHGKYGKPCPACGAPIQRIVYGKRETNYCPPCQTGGKIYADRALSRLIRDDWPRTLEEWEVMKRRR